jgi:uncharacterized protein (TIGR03083 family)
MHEAFVRQIADERAALLGFLAGVGDEDWSLPTVCTGWTVKDVLAHMVEGELTLGSIYRGEIRELQPVDNEVGIAKWRALPGVAVRAAFWQHGTAAQRVLDPMTEETWHTQIDALGCREIRQLVRLHLFDLAVHGHDLTDALGALPCWTDRLPFLVEFVVRAAPAILNRANVSSGALHLQVDGREWTIDGTGGLWVLGTPEQPGSASLSIQPEELVLLTTGRRPQPEVLEGTSITGDRGLTEQILGSWRVV